MSFFAHIDPIFLETMLLRLMPWFLAVAGGDAVAARQAAVCLLGSYGVETEEEIRLAAEIASFGLGSLDALVKSMDPDLSLNAILRQRGSANALQRSKNQCQRTLDKLLKQRRTGVAALPPETAAKPVEQVVPSKAGASDAPAAAPSAAEFHLSRQQRRAVERAVVKAQRKQAERDRLTSMRAHRAGAAAGVEVVMPTVREVADRLLAA